MQDIVIETLNDKDFLKVTLTTEIDEINVLIDSLKKFREVQNYITLIKIKENLKRNGMYKGKNKEEVKAKIDYLVAEFVEVKQYIESMKALEEFQRNLNKLENLISIDDFIYTKESQEKKYISSKTALKYLLIIKLKENLPLQTSVDELNKYIDSVRRSLQDNVHYDDDKVVDKILSFKIYENPNNYDIKNIEELPSISFNSLTKERELSKREEEAFYGAEAYKVLGLVKSNDKQKKKVL